MDTNWLKLLASDSSGDFDVTAQLDAELSRLALQARTNQEAAWTLLGSLSWKIQRFVNRFRAWDLAPFHLDDVVQEAYLVYLDTIQRWTPRDLDGEPTGYLYYFLKVFPLWLSNAVRRMRRPTLPPVIRAVAARPAAHDDDTVIINDFCRNLGNDEATLVRLRVAAGLSVPRAAKRMGLSRRTAYRRWERVVEAGREYMRE